MVIQWWLFSPSEVRDPDSVTQNRSCEDSREQERSKNKLSRTHLERSLVWVCM